MSKKCIIDEPLKPTNDDNVKTVTNPANDSEAKTEGEAETTKNDNDPIEVIEEGLERQTASAIGHVPLPGPGTGTGVKK